MIFGVMRADKHNGHKSVSKYRVEKRLPLMKSPTLLIYGTNDLSNWKIEDGLKTSQAIPRSTVKFIEGGTSGVINQMPKKFNELVLNFLQNPEI